MKDRNCFDFNNSRRYHVVRYFNRFGGFYGLSGMTLPMHSNLASVDPDPIWGQ